MVSAANPDASTIPKPSVSFPGTEQIAVAGSASHVRSTEEQSVISGIFPNSISEHHLSDVDKLISGSEQSWTNLLGNAKDVDELFKGVLTDATEQHPSVGKIFVLYDQI